VGQRDEITTDFASLFYRTGIPFRVAESNAMKTFIKNIRPAYYDFIPSAATIGNSLLSEEYEELFELGQSYISNPRSYSLVSDGWSNKERAYGEFCPGYSWLQAFLLAWPFYCWSSTDLNKYSRCYGKGY
jgi:hypothetical protein